MGKTPLTWCKKGPGMGGKGVKEGSQGETGGRNVSVHLIPVDNLSRSGSYS